MRRNLSGIYFRENIDGKWENVCFEDCSVEKQDEILDKAEPIFLKNLCKMLAKSLVELGEFADVMKE